MEITIRLFASFDLGSLLILFNQSRKAAGCFAKREFSLSEFERQIAEEKIYVAEIYGQTVGFVSIYLPENFIHHLYVSPTYTKQGVGRALLEHCQHEQGLPLSLKCLKHNKTACRFYENLGWVHSHSGFSREGFYNLYRLNHEMRKN